MNQKKYWDNYSRTYSDVWTASENKRILNVLELEFINSYILKVIDTTQSRRYLDIGCGTGRIMATIIAADSHFDSIDAVDMSGKMIGICRKRFRNQKIRYHNITLSSLSALKKNRFTFATSIRVLKYDSDIRKTLHYVNLLLVPQSYFIFTFTNKISLAYFDNLRICHYKQGPNEIRHLLSSNNFDVIDMKGFQKMPDIMYKIFEIIGFVKILYFIDNLFSRLLGNVLFSRNIFVVARKKS